MIRMDLQLHFFWSFTLTILAVLYKPLIVSGIILTVLKEALDVAAQKGWSWGDFTWGTAGFLAGLGFLNFINFL